MGSQCHIRALCRPSPDPWSSSSALCWRVLLDCVRQSTLLWRKQRRRSRRRDCKFAATLLFSRMWFPAKCKVRSQCRQYPQSDTVRHIISLESLVQWHRTLGLGHNMRPTTVALPESINERSTLTILPNHQPFNHSQVDANCTPWLDILQSQRQGSIWRWQSGSGSIHIYRVCW